MPSWSCSCRSPVIVATTSGEMAGRDEKEPWYWQHESFKFDSESPLGLHNDNVYILQFSHWSWTIESAKLESSYLVPWLKNSLSFFAVITPSFWEELTENGGDSPILYGVAPVMDTRSQPSSAACYAFAVDHQGTQMIIWSSKYLQNLYLIEWTDWKWTISVKLKEPHEAWGVC